MRGIIVTICALLLSWAINCPAEEEALEEAQIRHMFGLDATTEIFYESEAGDSLTFEEFQKFVIEGKSFGHPMGE